MARWGRPAAVAGWEERTAARRRRERDDAPVELQRLVGELRQCKDRCELSLTSLAAKTGFSVSSWQRYLGGRSLPPWEAVDALGRLGQAGTWQVTGGLGSGCGRLGGYRPTPYGTGPGPVAEDRSGAGSDRSCGGVSGVAADGMRRPRRSGVCAGGRFGRASLGWRPRAGSAGCAGRRADLALAAALDGVPVGSAVRAGRLPGTRSVSAAVRPGRGHGAPSPGARADFDAALEPGLSRRLGRGPTDPGNLNSCWSPGST
nr:helix-turn-helix transcriptional regulator [Streptomyces mirabilis]